MERKMSLNDDFVPLGKGGQDEDNNDTSKHTDGKDSVYARGFQKKTTKGSATPKDAKRISDNKGKKSRFILEVEGEDDNDGPITVGKKRKLSPIDSKKSDDKETSSKQSQKTTTTTTTGKKKNTSEEQKEKKDAELKYSRGPALKQLHTIKDKKLRSKIIKTEKMIKTASTKALKAELLMTEEVGFMEPEEGSIQKTYKVKQSDIKSMVDISSAKKVFDLKLDTLGPYSMDFSRNGTHLLLGGSKGHIAMIERSKNRILTEFYVNETIRDVKVLHNHTMFAVAQKKYVFIYDQKGVELHCLKHHVAPTRLEFLPYHFLLVSTAKTGFLKYQDTSTGQLVVEHRTKLGPCDVMTQNPSNGIILMGHNSGVVTMWSPNMSAPLVKMLCHKAPLRALAVDSTGNYMASSGMDGRMHIWDVRTYKELHTYFTPTPASSLSISQTGLLSVAYGPNVQVWKDALREKQHTPYMTHLIGGSTIERAKFCPYEDVLGVSHSSGYSSLLIPGAGLAAFDSFEANPYQTKDQRREAEVHSLLEKLQPEMININSDSMIGALDRASKDVIEKEKSDTSMTKKKEKKKKAKKLGRHIGRSLRNKDKNVIDERMMKKQELMAKAKEEKQKEKETKLSAQEKPSYTLDRFKKKKQ